VLVKKVTASNFAKATKLEVDLPSTGLVFITGQNGHGKSTLVEAVAQACWYSPLRGAPGWVAGKSSGVRVDFEGGHVHRIVKKSSQKLTWAVGGNGSGAGYATRTKSQAAFESHVGNIDVWRNACTFHTRDADQFSSASDSARKRLLEEVLELDKVERAYKAARAERKSAQLEQDSAEHEVALTNAKIHGCEREQAAFTGELEEVEDIDALEQALAEVEVAKALARGKWTELQSKHTMERNLCTRIQSKLGLIELQLERFQKNTGDAECSECKQAVDQEHADAVVKELETRISAGCGKLNEAVSVADNTLALYNEEAEKVNTYAEEAYDYERRLEKSRAANSRNSSKHARITEVQGEIDTLLASLGAAEARRDSAMAKVALLSAAVDALGTTGVRAALLDGSVLALESTANAYLSRMGLDKLTIKLSSQSKTKAGKVNDKISFDVEGAGGGYGYKACSSGEQRRIDIAVMLGLSDLSKTNAKLAENSTLFFDELFDTLDTVGVEAVTGLLEELAETRCVVVITHNEELAAAFPTASQIRAVDGVLQGI
jgi:DNA repair exonuclease SbcCD ATPase subunit